MYGKIFESLYEQSMVGAGPIVFAVWPYIIARQKPSREYGSTVELNSLLISIIIGKGTTEKQVAEAIEFLCSPDPKSSTKAKEGRRLVRLTQYEYQVVNGAMYRAIRDQEERKTQNREAQRRYRQKKKNENASENGGVYETAAQGNGCS